MNVLWKKGKKKEKIVLIALILTLFLPTFLAGNLYELDDAGAYSGSVWWSDGQTANKDVKIFSDVEKIACYEKCEQTILIQNVSNKNQLFFPSVWFDNETINDIRIEVLDADKLLPVQAQSKQRVLNNRGGFGSKVFDYSVGFDNVLFVPKHSIVLIKVSFGGSGSGEYVFKLNDDLWLDPDYDFQDWAAWNTFEDWDYAVVGSDIVSVYRTWVAGGNWDINYTDSNWVWSNKGSAGNPKSIYTPLEISNLGDYDKNIYLGGIWAGTTNSGSNYCVFCQTTDMDGPGYRIYTDNTDAFKFQIETDSGTTDLYSGSYSAGSFHDVNISRTTAGEWRLWVDGSHVATFTDTNFTDSNYTGFWHTTAAVDASKFKKIEFFAPDNHLKILPPQDAVTDTNITPYSITVTYADSSTEDFNNLTGIKHLYNLVNGSCSIFMDNVSGNDYNSGTFDFTMSSGVETVIDEDLNQVPIILINVPRDEATGETIAYYSVTVREPDGTYTDYNNQISTLRIYGITNGTYEITVDDTNGNSYYSRKHEKTINTSTHSTTEISPFLVKTMDSTSFSLKVVDSATLLPVTEEVIIEQYADVNGYSNKQLVEEQILDDKAQGTFSGIDLKKYDFNLLYAGSLKTIKTISIDSSTIIISIQTEEYDWDSETLSTISASWNPFIGFMSQGVDNFSMLIHWQNKYLVNVRRVVTMLDVNGVVGLDKNALDDNVSVTTSSPFIVFNDVNIMSYMINDTNKIKIIVYVYDTNGEYWLFEKTYSKFVRTSSVLTSVIDNLTIGLRREFGCQTSNLQQPCAALGILALFITLVVTAILASGLGYMVGGMSGSIIIALILLGFFTYIAWIPVVLYVIMFIFTIGIALSKVGGEA